MLLALQMASSTTFHSPSILSGACESAENRQSLSDFVFDVVSESSRMRERKAQGELRLLAVILPSGEESTLCSWKTSLTQASPCQGKFLNGFLYLQSYLCQYVHQLDAVSQERRVSSVCQVSSPINLFLASDCSISGSHRWLRNELTEAVDFKRSMLAFLFLTSTLIPIRVELSAHQSIFFFDNISGLSLDTAWITMKHTAILVILVSSIR